MDVSDERGAAMLVEIIERIERLIDQRATINGAIADVRKFAVELGYDAKGISAVLKARQMEADKGRAVRQMSEATIEAYRAALGIEGPDFAISLPQPATVIPARSKRITARERQFREVLQLQQASRATEARRVPLLEEGQ